MKLLHAFQTWIGSALIVMAAGCSAAPTHEGSGDTSEVSTSGRPDSSGSTGSSSTTSATGSGGSSSGSASTGTGSSGSSSGGSPSSSSAGGGGTSSASSGGIACVTATDCPAPPPCHVATCSAHTCGLGQAPSGTTCGGDSVCCQGACSTTCSLPMPQTLAYASGTPGPIAVDASFVYWVDTSNNAAFRMPLAGGTPQKLASGPGAMPGLSGIAVAGNSVYWTNQGGAVMQAPSAGGSPTTIAIEPYPTTGIASDGSSIFWATSDFDGNIFKTPIGGDASVVLSEAHHANAVAADANNVYWTGAAQVLQVAINGGTSLLVADEIGTEPYGLSVNGTSVYWTDNLNGRVFRSPISAGSSTPPPATALAIGQAHPTFLTTDDVSVYFTTINAVMRIPEEGGMPMKIADDQANGMAIDDDYVYWTSVSGAIVRIAK